MSPVFLKQPDGSVFQAKIKGDEFTRIKTDAFGHAIIQGEDGWWRYATYGENGEKTSSGWKVGSDAPDGILTESRIIPYGQLSLKAQERRRTEYRTSEEPVLRRIRRHGSVQTKGENDSEPVIKHGLVILANFKDISFKHTKEEFENLLTEQGYSVNGATGSAKEYFDAQFQGIMEFDFYVSDIVTLSKNRSYYGSNTSAGDDKAPAEMIAEACTLADAEIDFSLYDDDKDGAVDNVFVFFAGQDEAEGASEDCIWSHAWYIRSGAGIRLDLDGTIIDRYACSSELTIAFDTQGNIHEYISGIGTFCHEYSHTLGLPDFYDTDYEESGGVAAGLWTKTSLMDGGNYNNMGNTPPYYNAIERIIAGISEPEVLSKTGTYTLEPVNRKGSSYMLPTDREDIFYLFECRKATDWDRYIGGSGMLAYKIDLSDEGYTKWLINNKVNTDPSRQHVDLLEADGRKDRFSTMDEFQSGRQSIAGIFFPFSDIDHLNIDNQDALKSIRKSGDNIKFNFLNNGALAPPTVVNVLRDVFADAAIIRFESSHPYDGEATVAWGRPGQEKDTLHIKPYDTSKYAFTLENLEPAGKTYEIDIFFTSEEIESEVKSTSVMTKRMPSVQWPYIYLGSMERNSDGRFKAGAEFPMRIYGATGAEEIRWEFNGSPITVEADGYYTLNKSGVLTATVYWEDGSIDKVMKQINISQEE